MVNLNALAPVVQEWKADFMVEFSRMDESVKNDLTIEKAQDLVRSFFNRKLNEYSQIHPLDRAATQAMANARHNFVVTLARELLVKHPL